MKTVSPRDKFISQDSENKSIDTTIDAKKTLINLMEKIKSDQQLTAQDKKEDKKIAKPIKKSKQK